jgi:hypothetical protein
MANAPSALEAKARRAPSGDQAGAYSVPRSGVRRRALRPAAWVALWRTSALFGTTVLSVPDFDRYESHAQIA